MARTALALDIGICTITAATRDSDGRVEWVEIDGQSVFGAGLVVDDDLKPRAARPDDAATVSQLGPVLTRLGGETVIEGTAWPFPALLRILLAPIIAAATKKVGGHLQDVLVVVPRRWRDEDSLAFQLAVHTALSRQVRLVPPDKALAFAIPQPAVGEASIVVDAGADVLSMVVVASGRRGPRIVGRNTVDEGGDTFDRLLLANGITTAGHPEHALGPRWAWVGVPRVRHARLALADLDVTDVDLPAPVGRIALSGADVDDVGAVFFSSQLTDLLSTQIESAAGDLHGRRALVLCGGLALDPAVSAAAREITGIAPTVMPDPAHALCRGALRFDGAVDSTADPDPVAAAAAPDVTTPDLPAARSSSRRTALYGAGGLVAVAAVVAGALMWSSSVTPPPEWSDTVAWQAALAVLPQSTSMEGLYVKQWTPSSGIDDQTVLRSRDTALTLTCGGDSTVTDPEKGGVRVQSARVFVVSQSAAAPTERAQFDWAHSGSSVIVDATVLSRAERDTIWAYLARANTLCPSTQLNVVRNIVPVPVDGPDPGPPTYARDKSPLTTHPTATPTSTTANRIGGVSTGPQRFAWRGLISPAQTGTGVGLNVTCIATLEDVVVRRSCATAEMSAEADRMATAGIEAFNPAPDEQ